MGSIQDHAYLKICAQLASCLSISIGSAKKRVDLASARDGIKDLEGRKKLAEQLLLKAKSIRAEEASSKTLDQLLVALAEEENFMVED